MSSTDRIEKNVHLKASRSRVWRALTDAKEFGTWFKCVVEGPFEVDYSPEPMTLVELRLEEVSGGTRLTVTESGFDKIPAARRAEAFRGNEGGWTAQMNNIEAHVAG